MNNHKYKLFIIVSIVILVLFVGVSLAWYVWSSSDTSVSLNVCAPEISFIGGSTINGEGLKPVIDKEDGLKKQIDVYLNKICNEGDSAVMNLYMTLDLLPEGLKHETFIFEVIKDNEIIYSGNFKNKQEGETITLLEDEKITSDNSIYFVYVYIDGTRDNPSSMSGQSFRFTVYGEGTNAIYKENVIANPSTPTDSTSVFLTTNIARNKIKTITIAENNTVPEAAQETAVDISSNEDGSVMLWYTDDDGDELLDVYMGSQNGVIYANTNGQGMFAYLENVESLDLTRLDTSNITNMNSMFQGSSSLTSIDLSNFDTSNVTGMGSMFAYCNALTSLDLSSFDTSNVGWLGTMFYECTNLSSLDLSNFNTIKITSFSGLFAYCSSLTYVDLSNFDTSNVTNMGSMFFECNNLTTIDLSSFDTSNVTNMSLMFYDCYSLTNLDLSNFNTSNVTMMNSMFNHCENLRSLDLSNFDTSNVTDMSAMFSTCSSLTSLDLSSFDTGNVTNMSQMFWCCVNLISLDLSSFDTSDVTNMYQMFWYCTNLISLDLSFFDTGKVTDMSQIFKDSIKLTTIYISDKWSTDSVTESTDMFRNCSSLVGGSGTVYNASYVDKTYAKVDGGTSSPGYFTLKSS